MYRVTIIVIFALLGLVSAKSWDGSDSIKAKEFKSFDYDGPFTLDYSISSNGGNVDIYLLTDQSYYNWKNSVFSKPEYVIGASKEDTDNFSVKDFSIDSQDTYHLVVFNPSIIDAVAINYQVSFNPTVHGLEAWKVALIAIATLCGIILLIVALAHVYNKRNIEKQPLLG